MKVAPSVEAILVGFPKKEHKIDIITGIPKRLALNIMFEALTKNAASISTLKYGGPFGHTAMCMSAAQYATIQHSVPFIMATAPGELIFVGEIQQYSTGRYKITILQKCLQL